MSLRAFVPRAVLTVILMALPAAADAPRDQYRPFDSDFATIQDNFTKLEWDRRSVIEKVQYGSALGGCATLQSLNSAGRLPTIKELHTLLDEEPHNEYEFGRVVLKHIDAVAFAGAPVDLPYWSSTPARSGKVWALSFATAEMVQLAPSDLAHARCVR